jgi:hypothetical protein
MKKISISAVILLLPMFLFAAYPEFTYDANQDFEASMSGSWSESDAGSVMDPLDSAAEYVGTYGCSYAATATADAKTVYTFGTANASNSVGFWYKTGQYAVWAGVRSLAIWYNNSQGSIIKIMEGRSAGDNTRQLALNNGIGGVVPITVSDNTWYWITAQVVRNATCSMAIYNTALAQVGSTATVDGRDYPINLLQFGGDGVASSTAVYFDEIYIDYTDSTFPLGPPSEGTASVGKKGMMLGVWH